MSELGATEPIDTERPVVTWLEEWRAITLTGIILGALVGGVGGRLAMFVLRLTSADSVRGVISDDGFEIGQITLGGTYDLILVSAGIGVIGAGGYALVERWLIGPGWFRLVTAALGAGLVVGSMLVHADGVDFTLLGPVWFAIALFIAIPALFGGVVGPLLNWFRPDDPPARAGWWHWAAPMVAVAFFPATIPLVLVLGAVLAAGMALRSSGLFTHLHEVVAYRIVLRGAWAGIAVLGLVALVTDIAEIY